MNKEINKTNHDTTVTLVKDIMYKTVNIKGKQVKRDCDNPKIFYLNLK